MDQFQPVNSDNAVERMAFFVELEEELDTEQLLAFQAQHGRFSKSLPASRQASAFRMGPGKDGAPRLERRPAVDFAFLRADGSATWSLKLIGRELVVECGLYTHWVRVWPRAKELLAEALIVLTEQGVEKVRSTGLSVVDVFKGGGQAEAGEVLKPSDFLPPWIFATKSEWHIHSGRFREVDGGGPDLLDNLEVELTSSSDRVYRRLSVEQTFSRPLVKDLADNGLSTEMDRLMNAFHHINKETLSAILTDDVASRIRLLRKAL